MHQVSPEDQLHALNRQQADWRVQAARDHMASSVPAPAAPRRSDATRVEGIGVHHALARAAQLLHAIMPRHGSGGPRPAH